MKWHPNIPDAVPAENSDNSSDFRSSQEERGLIPIYPTNWPVLASVGIAIVAVLVVLFLV